MTREEAEKILTHPLVDRIPATLVAEARAVVELGQHWRRD